MWMHKHPVNNEYNLLLLPLPVIAVGRINDVEIAESVLQADKADLVTMARASLIKETN